MIRGMNKMKESMIEWTGNYSGVHRTVIRPEVAVFAMEMESVLRKNDHKTGWNEMSVHQLFSRIKDEFEELQREYILQTNSLDGVDRRDRLWNEAIDVANFCMFLSYWTHKNDPVDDDERGE